VSEVKALLIRVLDLVVLVHGAAYGVLMMRKLIGYWSKGVPGVRSFRAGVMTITDHQELRAFIEGRFGVHPDAEAVEAAAGLDEATPAPEAP
jgi:hypothetical protein